jgi:hypothetical protein
LPGRGKTAVGFMVESYDSMTILNEGPALLRAVPTILSYATRCQTFLKPAS